MQGNNIGQIYTLDAKKANGDNDLIVDTCHLNNHPCFVLFNCGASHSFISTQYVKLLGFEVIPLSLPMVVSTTMDSSVETHWQYESCSLSMNGRVFQIYLMCLPLKKVDVVLGMH